MAWVSYLIGHLPDIGGLMWQQLEMAGVAVVLGIFTGGPVGVWIARHPSWAPPVIWLTNLLQTIPVLALLGFVLIILGLGETTAVSVLFVYTLMPIVRAVYVGLSTVPPEILEAAKGLGMDRRQIWRQVELPLALPVIFMGLRMAMVIAVGGGTIMSLVGAGGLGNEIFMGINEQDGAMVTAGAVAVAGLAMGTDWVLGRIEGAVVSRGISKNPSRRSSNTTRRVSLL